MQNERKVVYEVRLEWSVKAILLAGLIVLGISVLNSSPVERAFAQGFPFPSSITLKHETSPPARIEFKCDGCGR